VPTNFTAAARWQKQDSERLRAQSSYAGADHLLGLSVECALKSVLIGLGVRPDASGDIDKSQRRFRKHMPELFDEFKTYSGNPYVQELPPTMNPFEHWKIDDRYSACEHLDEARIRAHEADAAIIFAMFQKAIDGGHFQP
jgi:hypothetical protein